MLLNPLLSNNIFRVSESLNWQNGSVIHYAVSSKKFLEQHAIPYLTFSETIDFKIMPVRGALKRSKL